MQEMGNPFTEESNDLLVLDTKDIADSSAAELIAVHHQRGKEQFKSFMTDWRRSVLFLQAYQEEYDNSLEAQASCQRNKL